MIISIVGTAIAPGNYALRSSILPWYLRIYVPFSIAYGLTVSVGWWQNLCVISPIIGIITASHGAFGRGTDGVDNPQHLQCLWRHEKKAIRSEYGLTLGSFNSALRHRNLLPPKQLVD